MRSRSFSKMHGLGNDFVLFDATREPLALTPDQIRAIADRHLGIGCDQILVVEPAVAAGVDFGWRIFNADGSESYQCGNGARCLAAYVRRIGLTHASRIVVATGAGEMVLEALADGRVRVAMGVPEFEPAAIPFTAEVRAPDYRLTLARERAVTIQALAIGNPHAVLRVDDVDAAPVATLGPEIERHPRFVQRANVGFMQVTDAGHIDLRVFERGAGETSACGSGACAAVVAGRLGHGLAERVQVRLPGGILEVAWAGEGEPVFLTGPATHVFDGELEFR